jgi:membrane protein
MKKALQITKQTFSAFSEDNVLRLSAALAYYSIFSLGPLLIIIVGVAGIVLGQGGADNVRHQIQEALQNLLGPQSAKVVESMMSNQTKSGGIVTTVVGVVTLLLGASGVFGQLQDALNTIWGVKAKPGIGIWGFLRHRFLSFGMVLGIGFLLLISMVLTTALSALMKNMGGLLPMSEAVAHTINFVVSFGVITLLFAIMFKFLPDVKVRWSDVWAGAVLTSLLFTIGKFLLGLYLGRASTTSSYGAAGSVVLILLWVYYASIIIFLGAEFTQAYAKARGHKTEPKKYAVPVTEEERAEEGMSEGGKKAAPKAGGEREARPTRPSAAHAPAAAMATSTPSTIQVQAEVERADRPHAPFGPIQEHPWRFATLAMSLGVAMGALHKSGAMKVLKKARKAAGTA